MEAQLVIAPDVFQDLGTYIKSLGGLVRIQGMANWRLDTHM